MFNKIAKNILTIFLLVLFNLIVLNKVTTTHLAHAEVSAIKIFISGDIEKARAVFKKELLQAEQSKNKNEIWRTLINLAWFEDEVSQHRKAIEYSNKALEIANNLNDQYKIGKSLCWLGWANTRLGLYELALSFYENAIEIGAPNGEIKYPSVWGLALQETGSIYFKMGDTTGAKKRLEKTHNYAVNNKLDIAITEGGAHLAEIALSEGNFAKAKEYALQAVRAGTKCNCSNYNLGKAKVVLAKVTLETNKYRYRAKEIINETLQFCEQKKLPRCKSEAKLLLSDTLDKKNFTKRFELVEQAFMELANHESELRGSAEASLGRVFLDNSKVELAEFYLKNGLKINQELFRKVANTHVNLSIAELEGLKGDKKKELQTLSDTIDKALETNSLPVALKAQQKMIENLKSAGFKKMAYERSNQAIELINKLIKKSQGTIKESEFRELYFKIYRERAALGVQNYGDSKDASNF